MATETSVNSGKTSFVEKFLKQNGDTNRTAINEAWKATGNTDQISESLVYKLRAEQGFTGKKPMNKVQVTVKSSSSLKAKSKSASKATAPKVKAAAQPTSSPVVSATPKPVAPPAKSVTVPKAAKEPKTPTPAPAAVKHTEHQAQVADEVESGIDELIFTLKTSGGNPEVEAALRAARRLLLTHHHVE